MSEDSGEKVRDEAQGIDSRSGTGGNTDRPVVDDDGVGRDAVGKAFVPSAGFRVTGVIVCILGAAVSLTVAQGGLQAVELLDRTGGPITVMYGLFLVAMGLTVFVVSVVSAVAFTIVKRSASLGIRMKLLQGAGVGLLTLGLAIAAEFFTLFR